MNSEDLHRHAHSVRCRHCRGEFELFAARWCGHRRRRSKLCPDCGRCLCREPDYANPHLWKDAPAAFQDSGFERLFLDYL